MQESSQFAQESSQFAQEQDAKIAEEKGRDLAAVATEIQEETKEEALESLLQKVDLNDPVIVEDARGNELAITKQQFIDFYLPEGISRLEAFHCFQQVRASGLNPLIKGQCHFFKTGEGPVSLFTGYEVYLARAYNNSMEHMEEPVWEIGEDGLPISCTLTIHIKGRPPFTRTTRYAEVVGLFNGKPNKRWDRAPFQMTEKCTTINTLRLAGIAAVDDLPYAIEEMGDPVVVGHRTLTQEQLDTYGAEKIEATPGEVSADYHKPIDEWQKAYHATWKDEGIFANDEERHAWESFFFNKPSSADFDIIEYRAGFKEFDSGRAATWVQEYRANNTRPDPAPPAGAKTEEQTGGDAFLDNMSDVPAKQRFLDESEKRFASIADLEEWCKPIILGIPWTDWTDANFETALPLLLEVLLLPAEGAAKEIVPPETPAGAKERQEQATVPVKQATLARLSELVKTFPGALYMTVKSNSFKERAAEVIGHGVTSIRDYTETEAQSIIASLEDEKAAINGTGPRVVSETVGEEIVDDDPLNQGEPAEDAENPSPEDDKSSWEQSNEIYSLLAELLPGATNHKGESIASTTAQARGWISQTIGYRSPGIDHLSGTEADDVILGLKDKLSERNAEESNAPKVV